MVRPSADTAKLRKLRSQWGSFLFAGITTIVIASWSIRRETVATPWLFLALSVFLYQAIIFFFDLHLNHGRNSRRLLPGFGLGTWLSLARLLALSLLAGFLTTRRYENGLAWVPFVLYSAFNLIDLVDGYAARRRGQVTRLGGKLDLDLDGRGMLVGSLMAVLMGKVGWWYLLVGLVRYLYVIGIWLRLRLALPVIEKANPRSRPLAGLQMGIATALLAPALHPPYTVLISTLVMIPFLANFLYDWLMIERRRVVKGNFLPDWTSTLLRVVLRLLLVALLAYHFVTTENSVSAAAIELLVMTGLFIGAGVRVLCLVLLIEIGLVLQDLPLQIIDLLISTISLALVYLGSGSWSLWEPETFILRRRLGEPNRN